MQICSGNDQYRHKFADLSDDQESKQQMHERNRNKERYDLRAMAANCEELQRHLITNPKGEVSVKFSDPSAVRALNKAILQHYYGLNNWDFPTDNLCPGVPGRAEYVHLLADLLSESNAGKLPKGDKITCLDIGTGASCIYPIIGVLDYDWNFIGSDINPASIESATAIVESNPQLVGKITCRLQTRQDRMFEGILSTEDRIDLSMCNPPFHSNAEEARKSTARKVRNLKGVPGKQDALNFSGLQQELIYGGGEWRFIANMIRESKGLAKSVFWFTTLVSKEQNLKKINRLLDKMKVVDKRMLEFATGNKRSRVVAWTFLTSKEQKDWSIQNWNLASPSLVKKKDRS